LVRTELRNIFNVELEVIKFLLKHVEGFTLKTSKIQLKKFIIVIMRI